MSLSIMRAAWCRCRRVWWEAACAGSARLAAQQGAAPCCRLPRRQAEAAQRKGAGMAGLFGMNVTLREKMAGAGELGTPRADPGTA